MLKNKNFKLRLQQVVERGEKYYKIIDWENSIKKDKLPFKYLEVTDGPAFITRDDCYLPHIEIIATDLSKNEILKPYIIYTNNCGDICIEYIKLYKNELYKSEVIEEVIKIMKVAGERLHNIRQKEKELKKYWNGEIVIFI